MAPCSSLTDEIETDDWNVTRWTPDRGYGVDAYEGHRLARQVIEDDPYRDEESIEFLLRHMRG